ncbi:MAG: hypothetical protein HY724_00895 [Candidatus Rokubacteria bacterium]|nr:hypothetical protein [Candidatus Rokubacteria bacterium]
MDAQATLNTLAHRLARRIVEVEALLRIDRAIGADPYDDVARLKELQRVRTWIRQLRASRRSDFLLPSGDDGHLHHP